MSAVRKGESPQKTEVLVGALIPNARVPVGAVKGRRYHEYKETRTRCEYHAYEATAKETK